MSSTPSFEERYFSGTALWGDDFDPAGLEEWLRDEREGYASLEGPGVEYAQVRGEEHGYGFRGFNEWYCFRHLPTQRFSSALGLGSAFGDEFLPIIDRIDRITIVEPSQLLRAERIERLVPRYVDPDPSGDLPFDDDEFDLVVCLGVLHHIANVSHVINEIGRVIQPGGWMVLREPVISMGDWRRPRMGLTPRERGIPRPLLDRMLKQAGFEIVKASWCDFPTTRRLSAVRPSLGYSGRPGSILDNALAKATAWNWRYHSRTPLEKVRPISTAYVLRRR